MRDADRIEHAGERDATRAEVGLIVTDPDVMERLGAEHGDVDRARRHRELIKSPCGAQRSPQPGETGADNDDVGHAFQVTWIRC